MFRDEFKERYTTIPLAIYRERSAGEAKELIAHHHGEVELIAMTEGMADFYVDTRHCRIEKGDILIIPPFSIHRAQIPPNQVVVYNCICFDLGLLWDEEIKTGLTHHTLSVKSAVRKEAAFAKNMKKLVYSK